MFKALLFIVILMQLLLLISCGTPKNFVHYVYLQDSITEAEKNISDSAAIILPGDRLGINITAINQTAAQAFNISSANVSSAAGSTGSGYLVDSGGYIQLLQIDSVKVKGLNTYQLADTITQRLKNYLVGPLVTVTITNFKINMLGEINKPGVLAVPDGKMNILEAISQSGDLTIYGRRDNILVIRTTNGKREFGRVDVSSNKVFESPYFNLKQNDFVYVEPDKTKFITNDAITTRNIRNLGLVITALSAVALVLNLIRR